MGLHFNAMSSAGESPEMGHRLAGDRGRGRQEPAAADGCQAPFAGMERCGLDGSDGGTVL